MGHAMETSSSRTERRRVWLLAFAVSTAIGVLTFGYNALDAVARAHPARVVETLIEEMAGAYGAGLLFPSILWFARRHRPAHGRVLRALALHLGALALVSGAHTSWNWVSRSLLFPLAGLGAYDYGAMPLRFLMELPKDAVWYALAVGFIYLFDHYREGRERELRTAHLETLLVRAQLQSLQAQLQPHFLFNALNTISSVMYEDVRAADRMLTRLSDLLRRALHASRSQEVTLREELEILEPYLDLMRARFGERLRIAVEIEDGVREAVVPALVLQPLVENAARHGAPPPPGEARIEIRGERDGDALVLEVRDNGRGLARPEESLLGKGLGLTNTAERLRGLYGERGQLAWRDAPEGGAVVTVRLPYRELRDPETRHREVEDRESPAAEAAWTASAS